MKKLLTIIFTLCVCLIYSQPDAQEGLSKDELTKLHMEYAEMRRSDDYLLIEKISQDLIEGMNGSDLTVMYDVDKFEGWLSENLADTKFSSKQQATDMLQQLIKQTEKINLKYAHIYSQIKKATPLQREIIIGAAIR
jgi:hypothetical protein